MAKTTKAFAAVNTRTVELATSGLYNLIISGTWSGEIKVLRRFENMRSLGTHTTGASAATLVHAVEDPAFVAVADSLIGMWISNDKDGSFGPITNNTDTTITATLAGGTQNDWDIGDVFSLWYVATTKTANCDVQAEEPEPNTTVLAIASTLASGTALVRISQ